MARLSVLFLAALATAPSSYYASAFSVGDGRASSAAATTATTATATTIARREYLSRTASLVVGGGLGVSSAAAALLSSPSSAFAAAIDESSSSSSSSYEDTTPRITTRMGGLLENYQDSRGWIILAPSGWNKFDGEVGAYDAKWQDLVDPTDNVKVSSTPVKSTTTSVDVLGPVAEVGKNLASKRNAKLISANERRTDGILFYAFDFALDDGTHQLLQLCVNKGKIWSLDANTKEKKFAKRREMYYNILGSFMPKLA